MILQNLHIEYSSLPYPYSDEEHDPNILWSRIFLRIADSRGGESLTILDFQWDIRPIVEWLHASKHEIVNEILPIQKFKGGSIAQQLFRYYDELDTETDTRINEVYEYRQSHCFVFAARGCDIQDIYIGLNNGNHEISFYDGQSSWCYNIDLSAFFYEVAKIKESLKI